MERKSNLFIRHVKCHPRTSAKIIGFHNTTLSLSHTHVWVCTLILRSIWGPHRRLKPTGIYSTSEPCHPAKHISAVITYLHRRTYYTMSCTLCLPPTVCSLPCTVVIHQPTTFVLRMTLKAGNAKKYMLKEHVHTSSFHVCVSCVSCALVPH